MIRECVEEYLRTPNGTTAYERYFSKCQINPQNLYVDNTDYLSRYIAEHELINMCISYFIERGYRKDGVLNDIPEIQEHYPFFIENDIIEGKYEEEFYIVLSKKVIEFYNKVNPRRYGEYYTSLDMINVALKYLDCNLELNVVDPSCGSGFILYAYITRLLKDDFVEKEKVIEKLHNNIYGYDVFPSAVIMTKFLLGYGVYQKFGYEKDIFSFRNIRIINTLSTLKCQNIEKDCGIPMFDLVIGNPPFFRVNPNGVDNVCKCTQYGHHYAHSLFLHWTLQYLKNEGDLCLILPESMLTGYYYQKVRSELINVTSIRNIILSKEHEKMFDVQQDVMILIATKGVKGKYYFTSTSDLTKGEENKFRLPMSVVENKYNVIPVIMNDNEWNLLNDVSMDRIVTCLDKFTISTGNYVWNQNKDKCFMDYDKDRKPLISGPSIVDGNIVVQHNRKNTYMFCEPDKIHYTLDRKAILFRRMSPMENERRFIGAIIDPQNIGKYVVENHVNIIQCDDDRKLVELYDFLMSESFNGVLEMFCRTNQVSVSDINTIFEILIRLGRERRDEQ